MKENWIREWAHAPWHCWLKEQPAWLDLFAELWARMPEIALRKILATTRTLVVLPPVHYGRVIRLSRPLLTGAHILQLDTKLLERPRKEQIGILAHEMGHLCSPVTEDETQNDLEADRFAIEWGFRDELVEALARDLESEHPRVKAAKKAA